jgi:formylglycine-generating enzyme required for sulfatase activity
VNRSIASAMLFCTAFLCATRPVIAVTMAWSSVGNPGNAADPLTGFGAVPYSYNIGTYDVTNNQYVAFLNSNDPTGANTLGLYDSLMSIKYNSGAANGTKYNVISGDGNQPIDYETWYSAIRFANWLNNGQVPGSTETGGYTLLGGTPTPSNANSITRNAGASIFLPNVNEWYKAAYNIPGTNSYYQYPTSSNTAPTASVPTGAINSANFDNVVGHLTDVGAYSGTTSPYGAFDMGGNLYQWTETFTGFSPNVRGGSFGNPFDDLLSVSQAGGGAGSDNAEVGGFGFRLASVITVPEPSSVILAALGLGGLVVYGWRRKRD